MIKLIFQCQLLANTLHDFQAKNILLRPLKNKVKNLIPDLIRHSETKFDLADKNAENELRTIYNALEDFSNQMSKVKIEDMPAVVYMYKAYQKDPKSINGICNKILEK